MNVCVCVCVYEWVNKEGILSSASFDGIKLFEGSLCVGYTWEVLALKRDKEMRCMDLCEDPRLDGTVEKDQGRWSVTSGTPAERKSSQSG